MSNVLIATPVLSDAATITASHAVAAGPISNVQRMQPTDTWESQNLTPFVVVYLGAVTSFNLIAVLFTNARQTDTWRIRTANTEANLTAAPTYDSAAVTFSPWNTRASRRHGFKFNAAGWSNSWIRIDFDSTGNPNGVFNVGRLYVANAYQPVRNYGYGNALGFIDTSPRDRTSGGNTIPNPQGIIPTHEFEIGYTDENEFFANTYAIQMLRGGSRDLLVIMDPDDTVNGHHKIGYGLLNPTSRTVNPTYRLWAQRYEIEGLI